MAPVWCDYGEATAVVPRPVLALAPVLAPVPVQDGEATAVVPRPVLALAPALAPVSVQAWLRLLVLVPVLVVLLLFPPRLRCGWRNTGCVSQ